MAILISKNKIINLSLPLLLILIIGIAGCATTSDVSMPEEIKVDTQITNINNSPVIEDTTARLILEDEVNNTSIEVVEDLKGIIFAKTIFEGVLKTTYVQLHFKGIGDNKHEFDLIIGEKDKAAALPWESKTVEPGYFNVELPAGKYKIKSIAIPVGSTLAEEQIDIDVEVFAGKATYVGTLKVIGTKEKIKLGGVPVIRPGFEYQVEVLNEKDEAYTSMSNQLPQFNNMFHEQLLKINHQHENSIPTQ